MRGGGLGTPDGARELAYGQVRPTTVVDRLGVWLSSRSIRRAVPDFSAKRIGDFGCGFQATFVRSILDDVARAVLVDVALAADLKEHPKVAAVEGTLPEALDAVETGSLDTILAISVLEHLWDPLAALQSFRRILAPGGTMLVNVPTWRGKWFLELSAFRLGLSPREEMDDHKAYYDPRDLWPLLVRSGFVPHNIRCFTHKLGLNTFAVCRAD
jgi:SAM-dependent methyltransferase